VGDEQEGRAVPAAQGRELVLGDGRIVDASPCRPVLSLTHPAARELLDAVLPAEPAAQGRELVEDLDLARRVEIRDRLVEDDEGRPGGERPGHLTGLSVPARQARVEEVLATVGLDPAVALRLPGPRGAG
jgi:hypothetical protein